MEQTKINEIKERYDELKKEEKLSSQDDKFKPLREEFQSKFSIDSLREKDGDNLINFLFKTANSKDSVAYYLEQKVGTTKQSELNSYFGTFRGLQAPAMQTNDGRWLSDNGKRKLMIDDVQEIAIKSKKIIINLSEIIEEVKSGEKEYKDIKNFFQKLKNDNKFSYTFFRKYLFILYPDILSSYIKSENDDRVSAFEKIKDYIGIPKDKQNDALIAEEIVYNTFGKDYIIDDIFDVIENILDETNDLNGDEDMETEPALNQILYGPPGTGKTYNTVVEAIRILKPELLHKYENKPTINDYRDWYKNISKSDEQIGKIFSSLEKFENEVSLFDVTNKEQLEKYRSRIKNTDRANSLTTDNYISPLCDHYLDFYKDFKCTYEDLKQEFDRLKNEEHRIEFITFHQSYSYEEFVEGIKPVLDDTNSKDLKYELKDGIFKNICESAKSIATITKHEPIDFSNTKVFKMSLGNTLEKEDDIYNYCIENNVVSLGFKDYDFSTCKTSEEFKEHDNSWGAIALERFVTWIDIGDIIIISNGNRKFRAIARVKGPYKYDKNTPISHTHFREVEWLYKGDDISYSKINDKIFSQQSIYGYFSSSKKGQPDYNPDLKTNELNKIITGEVNQEVSKPYVIIIDEINRGNISKIFGELITLIEPDKRIGAEHELKVTLPYSNELFGIPKNLYIIGTMNTADKSLALLDVALRRRFEFIPMYPKRAGFKNSDILNALNDEILKKKKSADYLIGHSYFMGDDSLENIFNHKVIPLLMEYFNGKTEDVKKLLESVFDVKWDENYQYTNDKNQTDYYYLQITDIKLKSKYAEEINQDEESQE